MRKRVRRSRIRFGPLDELHVVAKKRVEDLHARGFADAQVYDPVDTSVGGIHAFFLVLGNPEQFGLPPRPEVPTLYLKGAWLSAAMTSAPGAAGTCSPHLPWFETCRENHDENIMSTKPSNTPRASESRLDSLREEAQRTGPWLLPVHR